MLKMRTRGSGAELPVIKEMVHILPHFQSQLSRTIGVVLCEPAPVQALIPPLRNVARGV